MPGATLTETVDEAHWKATLQVKLGPVGLTFAADVACEEADPAAQRVRLSARAKEVRGRGGANATIESNLSTVEGGTRVDVVTDVQLSGTAAQFGGPVVKDVAAQLTREFAECLRRELSTSAVALGVNATPVTSPVKPVGGFSLLFRALLARFRR